MADFTGDGDSFESAIKDAIEKIRDTAVGEMPVPFVLKSIRGKAGRDIAGNPTLEVEITLTS